ncbi:hypothetical protein [Bacteroides propionicifaciens]|uniref:hypothetical protein n=1 Tax=Bacteroides propionicifaciens TaxID=392838 RepID=UPI0012DD87BF|nr:hypothetical protein [Bacteroides propionicifaciens]
MKCVKCRSEYNADQDAICPTCGATPKSFSFNAAELGPELCDRETSDATLRICSRIFLSLSIIGAIVCFIFMVYPGGGKQLVIGFLCSTGIACMGFIIWAASNVLANISCNLRELNKHLGEK